MKYVDYKATIWGRVTFDDNTDMSKIIEKLNQNWMPDELCSSELGFNNFEFLSDTEEFLPVEENDGQATIGVYEGQELIWDNSYESDLKRKQCIE